MRDETWGKDGGKDKMGEGRGVATNEGVEEVEK